MDGIHAPAEVLTRAKGVCMEKTKKRDYALRIAAVACASVLGVFGVTNGMCYAATGETWVEKSILWVSDTPADFDLDAEMTGASAPVGGEIEYSIEGEGSDGEDFALEGEDDSEGMSEMVDPSVEGTDQPQFAVPAQLMETDDGHYYVSPEGAEPQDVTDQLKGSGTAEGTFEKDGQTYVYKVSGEPGNYQVTVEAQAL